MRCFIAIEIPREVKDELVRVQKILMPTVKATWVKPEHMHLTIKFLGEVTPQTVERVKKKVSAVKFKPFTLTLGKLGTFSGKQGPRVVWAELLGDTTLAKDIDASLSDLFSREKDFVAHLTIARVKDVIDKRFFEEKMKTKLKPIQVAVKEFALISSTLTREGPEYKTLEAYS
jgi:2'-5' RNA ligase